MPKLTHDFIRHLNLSNNVIVSCVDCWMQMACKAILISTVDILEDDYLYNNMPTPAKAVSVTVIVEGSNCE